MQSSSPAAARDAAAARVQPPARSRIALVLPALVVLATAALLAYAAWPTVQPLPEVRVAQAVFAPDAAPAAAIAQQDAPRPTDAPPQDAPPPITRAVQAPGWLEADPFYESATSLIDGVVARIHALEGESVEAGQLVATLVDEDAELALARAEARLAQARASRDVAAAEADAARADWDEPVDQRRALDATTAQLAEANAELDRLPHLIEAAEAERRRFQEELARSKRSLASGAATEFEIIIARERLAAQTAHVDSLEAQRPILEARLRRFEAERRAAERDLQLRIAERRRLAAAKAQLARADADVRHAQVERDEARLRLDRTRVRAPIAGFVQDRLKSPGDKVMLGADNPESAHILHIYDPSRIQVRVDVPLADAAHVRVGQTAEVVVEVLPDRTFRGEVTRVTHEADLQKNTLEVKVRVLDPSPLLKPDMLTRVKFLASDADDRSPRSADAGSRGLAADAAARTAPPVIERAAVRVPAGAVLGGPDDRFVYAVRQRRGDRGTLHRVRIEPVESPTTAADVAPGYVHVLAAVQPGELLAIDAAELAPNARVRVVGADAPDQIAAKAAAPAESAPETEGDRS